MTPTELRDKVKNLHGQRSKVQQDLKEAKVAFVSASRSSSVTEEARVLIMRIAKETQEQIKFHVTGLGTMALNAAFGGGWELDVDFVEGSRGKMICPIRFLRGPERIPTNPLEDDSGGACYISAFGMRCANLTLQRPRVRSVLFLDEPALHLNSASGSRKMQEEFAVMVRKIADAGIQMIIVTGLAELENVADKVFKFSR